MPSRTAELKERYRLRGDSEPVCVLSELLKIVRGKGVVREREREQRSEEGIEGLYFGSERELGSNGKIRSKAVTELSIRVEEDIPIGDTRAQKKTKVFFRDLNGNLLPANESEVTTKIRETGGRAGGKKGRLGAIDTKPSSIAEEIKNLFDTGQSEEIDTFCPRGGVIRVHAVLKFLDGFEKRHEDIHEENEEERGEGTALLDTSSEVNAGWGGTRKGSVTVGVGEEDLDGPDNIRGDPNMG